MRLRWITGLAIFFALGAAACSGASSSDDDDGGSGGDDTSDGGKGGTAGTTGGTSNVGKGGSSAGGTGGGSVGGTGGGTAGPSGVPSDAYLDELNAEQLHALCVWGIPLQGGPGERECDDGVTLTTHTVKECSVDTVTIHCTVASVEACLLSLNGDPCALLTSTSCAADLQCALGS
jgi:hypothetical protein